MKINKWVGRLIFLNFFFCVCLFVCFLNEETFQINKKIN